MPVSELLTRHTSAELAEWMAYEQLTGPLGPARGDLQAAIIAATIANAHRGKGKKPFSPADFVPNWDGRRELTPEELWAKAFDAFSALGGEVSTSTPE